MSACQRARRIARSTITETCEKKPRRIGKNPGGVRGSEREESARPPGLETAALIGAAAKGRRKAPELVKTSGKGDIYAHSGRGREEDSGDSAVLEYAGEKRKRK